MVAITLGDHVHTGTDAAELISALASDDLIYGQIGAEIIFADFSDDRQR